MAVQIIFKVSLYTTPRSCTDIFFLEDIYLFHTQTQSGYHTDILKAGSLYQPGRRYTDKRARKKVKEANDIENG